MSADPASLLNQLASPGYRQTTPGQQATGSIRALLLSDDGQTPPTFTWKQRTYDSNGNFVDMPNGMTGSPQANPARDRNGNVPPEYPWEVELEPAIATVDKGTVWVCDVSCCSDVSAPTVPCDFVSAPGHPGQILPGWPAVVYLTLTNMQPSGTGTPVICYDLSYDVGGTIFPLTPGHGPQPTVDHWGVFTPQSIGGGAGPFCFGAGLSCSAHQLLFRLTLVSYTDFALPKCPGISPICNQSFGQLIGVAKLPFNYSGSGFFPDTSGQPSICLGRLCQNMTFDWQLSETMP